MNYAERTMIVTASTQQLAQGLCAGIADGSAGEGMFTTGLSATGLPPATHYISNGPIDSQFADLLPLTTYTEDGKQTKLGYPEVIEDLAAQAGIELPEGAVGHLLETAHITDAAVIGPFEVLAKLGLQLVQEES